MADDYDKNSIEFDPPEGYEPPEGAELDKDFDAIATFLVKPDGTMCLKAIGGLPVYRSQAPEKSVGEGMVDAFKNRIPAPMGIPWDQPIQSV